MARPLRAIPPTRPPRGALGSGALAVLALCLACPAETPAVEAEAKAPPSAPPGVQVPDTQDPRVVHDGEDLYTVDSAPRPAQDAPALGSGRPDTSNGVCKLFAPKLPEPKCCPLETGFDAERVKQICGHQLYMGESFRQSCGYFFLPDMQGSYATAIRVSKLAHQDIVTATADHDTRMARATRDPEFASTPVPGLDGAMWSEAEGIHWAFIPGWKSVRMVSWPDDACAMDKMPEVLKQIAESKEPPARAPRLGLVPKARR